MSDLAINTRRPQDTDTERLLLGRLLAAQAVKTTGTGLASAARTTTTQTADIDTTGFRAIVIFFNVTAASGTGGLTLRLRGKDPVTGFYASLTQDSAARTTTGLWTMNVGLGASAPSGASLTGSLTGLPLPDIIRVEVTHGDASSYTYSIGYCLVP
jgi:hypothetical protein